MLKEEFCSISTFFLRISSHIPQSRPPAAKQDKSCGGTAGRQREGPPVQLSANPLIVTDDYEERIHSCASTLEEFETVASAPRRRRLYISTTLRAMRGSRKTNSCVNHRPEAPVFCDRQRKQLQSLLDSMQYQSSLLLPG